MIQIAVLNNFNSYSLIDSGEGERLERFGDVLVRKPDPQCLWKRSLPEAEWNKADAVFEVDRGNFSLRSKNNEVGSAWHLRKGMPDRWKLHWQDISFFVEPTPFKHLGVFPEQAVHWEWMREEIKSNFSLRSKNKGDSPKILNLFGYTGIASVVCAKAGAAVTHVDASKPSISWAKENMLASGLQEDAIRWLLEDVLSFVKREERRGHKYDAIIMDPPAFGHGAKGEVWKFGEQFPELLDICERLLVDDPLFVIVNAYAVSVSSIMLGNMLEDLQFAKKGKVEQGELVLQQRNGRMLSTGIFGRWSKS